MLDGNTEAVQWSISLEVFVFQKTFGFISPHLQSIKAFIRLNSWVFTINYQLPDVMSLHSKHFTHAFQRSVCVLCECAHLCIRGVHIHPKECVRVCEFVGWRLFETWPRGPVGFMKGLFHVPFPSGVRLESSCPNQVLPYGKYLLGYSRILNRPFCEWEQNTDDV